MPPVDEAASCSHGVSGKDASVIGEHPAFVVSRVRGEQLSRMTDCDDASVLSDYQHRCSIDVALLHVRQGAVCVLQCVGGRLPANACGARFGEEDASVIAALGSDSDAPAATIPKGTGE